MVRFNNDWILKFIEDLVMGLLLEDTKEQIKDKVEKQSQ